MKTLEIGLSCEHLSERRWISALEFHQSGGGIACINDRACEGFRPRERLWEKI